MVFISDSVLPLTGWPAQAFIEGKVSLPKSCIQTMKNGWAQPLKKPLRSANPTTWSTASWILAMAGCAGCRKRAGRPTAGVRCPVVSGWGDDGYHRCQARAEFEGIVSALNRVVAIIELDLDGYVIGANDNYLRMMGYTGTRYWACTAKIFAPNES